MFEFLFGDGGKSLRQQENQLNQYKDEQSYNRTMANSMRDILADPNNAQLVANAGTDFINNWNNTGNSLRSNANRSQSTIDDMQKAYDKAEKADRYNYFGNGMLGAILNPIGQAATAIGDLVTGQYEANDRDWVSDLGAGVESALTLIPGLSGAKALTSAGKISKAGMALNALSGAGANVASQFREGGVDTDINDLGSAALTGAAFGGLVPAAMSKGGQFIKNRGAKALGNTLGGVAPTSRQLTTAGIKSLMPQSRVGRLGLAGAGLYGASRLLGGGGQAQVPNYQSQLDIMQGGYY